MGHLKKIKPLPKKRVGGAAGKKSLFGSTFRKKFRRRKLRALPRKRL